MPNHSKSVALLGVLLFTLLSCVTTPSQHPQEPVDLAATTAYAVEHFLSPQDYIVSQFTHHQIVIIGEFHRLRHDALLVQKVLPALYKAGVYTLAIEFANYEDQASIDALTSARTYDERLARRIALNSLVSIGLGGYQEYCDLFKAAWALNQTLPPGDRKFRVLGLNDAIDWSSMKVTADRENPELRRLVLKDSSEKNWADRLSAEVISRNEKALVYCGIHHAFTGYQQPSAANRTFKGFITSRFGNHVYKILGKKAFTIYLHAPWYPRSGYEAEQLVLPADGMVDYLLAQLPPDKRSLGFDTAGTPMGNFTGTSSIYQSGYEDFRLSDFCDGYICQGFLTDYQPSTPIAGFVNEENLSFVRDHFPNPDFRNAQAHHFNQALASDTKVFQKLSRSALQAARAIYQTVRPYDE